MTSATRASVHENKTGIATQVAGHYGHVVYERAAAYLLLIFAVGFNLRQLYPEVDISIPRLNDDLLHLLALRQTVDALLTGHDPTDSWLPSIGLGFPLFHHYQHLAYFPPALVYLLLQGAVPLRDVLDWTRYLLLSFFPISIYWSMRRFGFGRLPAAIAGLCAPLIATGGLLGFDFASYVWSGFGLYTQLCGMFLLPVALAQAFVVLRDGRGYFWAVSLLAATMLSHLIMGYIALGSLLLLTLVAAPTLREIWPRIRRLIGVLVPLGLVTAYFVAPFLIDSPYMNRSVWESPDKYNSYGHAWVLSALVGGELFDHGRIPVLTILVAVGLAVCVCRWRDVRYRVPLALSVVWLLLYFGRPTWGGLLDFLPMSRDLHFQRLIAGVHLGGIYLIGLGLALPWHWAWSHRSVRNLLVPPALTVLLLVPAYRERVDYLAENAHLMSQSRHQLLAQQTELTDLITVLRAAPPGRVYAGLGANWGRSYQVGYVPMYAILNDAGLDMVGYLYHALSLNSDVEILFDESRPDQYDLFNVRYVVAPTDHVFPDFVKPIRDFGQHRLYEVQTSGYFELVQSTVALQGDKTQFYSAASAWLQSDMPRLKQNPAVLFDGASRSYQESFPLQATSAIARAAQPLEPPAGQILAETVESNAYRAAIQVERESTLLLKVTYHPNWHASVDGVDVATSMVMPSYLGIEVPPGTHRVALEYEPRPLRRYLWLLGLLTLAVLAFIEWRPDLVPRVRFPVNFRLPHRPTAFQSSIAVQRLLGLHVGWLERVRPPALSRFPSSALVSLRVPLALYAFFLSVYLMSASGHFSSTDQIAVYLTTESIVEHGSLAIKPINDAVRGRDDHYYGAYGVGQSLVSIPLYVVGRLVDQISPSAVRAYFSGPRLCGPTPFGNVSCDWGGTVPIFFVSLLNQIVAPFTCVLVFLFSRQLGFALPRSILLTMIFGLGTGVWVYAKEPFQHTLESFALVLSIYIVFANRYQLNSTHVLLAGVSLGFDVLTRLNVLVVVPLLLTYVYAVTSHSQPRLSAIRRIDEKLTGSIDGPQIIRVRDAVRAFVDRDALRNVLLFSAPVILAVGIVMCVNYIKFGQLLEYNPNATAKGFNTPLLFGLYGNMFSVGRSIFLYSPPLALGLLGFRAFYARHRPEALLFAAICCVYLCVYSIYGYWEGGWAWGPRFLVPLIPLLLLPMGYWLTSTPRLVVAGIVAFVGAGVQVLGVAVGYSYVYHDWLAMGLVPENAFLFVPELSAIPMHLNALLQGKYLDLWLPWVRDTFGPGVLFLSLLPPLTLFGCAAAVLLRQPGCRPGARHPPNVRAAASRYSR